MEEDLKTYERSYRRGLVMGLTMAEIVMLLLFALLLIWMIGTQEQKTDAQKVQDLTRQVNNLQEQVKALTANMKPGEFGNQFRELRPKRDEVDILRRQAEVLQHLGEEVGIKDGSPEQIAKEIQARIDIAEYAKTASKDADITKPSGAELAPKLAELSRLQAELKRQGLDPKQVSSLGESARNLRKLGEQVGIPDGTPDQISERIRQRLNISDQLIRKAKSSPISSGASSDQELASTLASLAKVDKDLKGAAMTPEQAANLGVSWRLLQGLGEEVGAGEASPERISERVKEKLQIAKEVVDAAKASSLSTGVRTEEELASKIANLSKIDAELQKSGLTAKDGRYLSTAARSLNELGKEAGIKDGSPEEIAQRVHERLQIAKKVIEAAEKTPLAAGEPTESQLSSRLAGLAEVQQGLESAGLDSARAAALIEPAKVLRDLGRLAGVQEASPQEIAKRIGEELQISQATIDATNRSGMASQVPTKRELVSQLANLSKLDAELRKQGLDATQVSGLTQANEALRDLGKQVGVNGASPERIAASVREQLNIAGDIIEAAGDQKLAGKGNTKEQVRQRVAALANLQNQLAKQGLDPGTTAALLGSFQDKIHEKEIGLKSMQGRLRYAESQLKLLGRGTEKPACWADPETGKPEYIFDIALQSASVNIRDNALPSRREEQAKLPLQTIRFGTDLKMQEFREMTEPLFLWSEKEGCRFFVRVFDLTKPYEKKEYKVHLRTVGEHFYYYEQLDKPWVARNATTTP